ncbi:MAG: aminotransferase class I/II-fold pyridoxal phosphate-dependent enzyme, partial [Bacteroidota bacterium]
PGSHLDEKEFAPETQVLNGSTYLQVLLNNPNHIGVHTDKSESEPYFAGTQQLEVEVIKVISEDILGGVYEETDGYVSSGGTEGNIQAVWMYRNLFNEQYQLQEDYRDIRIVCSADTHYSLDKAANLLNVKIEKIPVDNDTRELDYDVLKQRLYDLRAAGVRFLIINCNMMTTMYGSVDDIDQIAAIVDSFDFTEVRYHVDGAYGGFLYPFTCTDQSLSLRNPRISSFTLDAHKMLQAPYGTGIFISRKGLIKYATTDSAKYVPGAECTLVGSRSGANAISIYKVLFRYGPYDWTERMQKLVRRARVLSEKLTELNYRHIFFEGSNIIAIHRDELSTEIAQQFGLVADDFDNPTWY